MADIRMSYIIVAKETADVSLENIIIEALSKDCITTENGQK